MKNTTGADEGYIIVYIMDNLKMRIERPLDDSINDVFLEIYCKSY